MGMYTYNIKNPAKAMGPEKEMSKRNTLSYKMQSLGKYVL